MEENLVPIRLFPRPKEATRGPGEFVFGKKLYLHISKSFLDREQMALFRELFSNFTAGITGLCVIPREDTLPVAVFSRERTETTPEPEAGKFDYALRIDRDRAVLCFHDAASLAHGMCTLLSQLELRSGNCCTLPVCSIRDWPEIPLRMIHVCVFPETRYLILRKFLRMIGFAKYTHVVLEFWGTFRYKCCRGMWGKNALTHRQVRKLCREVNAMGVEVVPMLNVLGHAAQSRAIYCKHTALDKDPRLSPLFEPDGWTWNLLNPDTVELLRKMRRELCDACGKGSFFHLGCDEAFPYGSSRLFDGKDKVTVLSEFLNGIADELETEGRRAMMWGDQLLNEPGRFRADCITYGESPEIARRLVEQLDRRIIMVDWQYYVKEPDIPTARFFSENGFDVILAPFDNVKAVGVCAGDVIRNGYLGFMQTTWHLMHGADMRMILRGATFGWEGQVELDKENIEFMGFESGSYQRRLLPARGNYRNSGIREKQIEV